MYTDFGSDVEESLLRRKRGYARKYISGRTSTAPGRLRRKKRIRSKIHQWTYQHCATKTRGIRKATLSLLHGETFEGTG